MAATYICDSCDTSLPRRHATSLRRYSSCCSARTTLIPTRAGSSLCKNTAKRRHGACTIRRPHVLRERRCRRLRPGGPPHGQYRPFIASTRLILRVSSGQRGRHGVLHPSVCTPLASSRGRHHPGRHASIGPTRFPWGSDA